MERENLRVEIDNHARYEGKKGTCSKTPFDRNDGNHTPPRTPRVIVVVCPLPIDNPIITLILNLRWCFEWLNLPLLRVNHLTPSLGDNPRFS